MSVQAKVQQDEELKRNVRMRSVKRREMFEPIEMMVQERW